MFHKNLVWGSSGNMSVKFSETEMLITASGSRLTALVPDDIVKVDVHSGVTHGDKHPTKEKSLHENIYKNRPDVNAVIHTSPAYAMLLCCSDEKLQENMFIESMVYLNQIEFVDYYHPGSDELAHAVSEAAMKSDIIIMKNHGVVVLAKTLEKALDLLETLETACMVHFLAKRSGHKLKSISPSNVNDFWENAGYTR